jgi:iron complex outermembrane recepter protein
MKQKRLSALKKHLMIGLFFTSQIMSGNALAEDLSTDIRKNMTRLDEIVVTATRTEKELANVPGSVSVVTGKEMEKRNITSADEALNTTSGVVDIRGKGMMDTMSRVTLRGIPGQERTLVLMDGLMVNSAYAGMVNWTGMAVGDLERIEVVKGPFSSLYGGNAMGGVINLITKLPEKRECTVKSGYGTGWNGNEAPMDLRKFYLSYGDKVYEKLRLFLSYNKIMTNGYPADLNLQSAVPTAGLTGWSETTDKLGNKRYLIGDKGDNAWRNDNMTFKGRYDLSEIFKVNVSFLRATGEYSYANPNTTLRDASGNRAWSYGTIKESSFLAGGGGFEQNMVQVGVETDVSQSKIKLTLGYFDQTASWGVTPDSTATRSEGSGKLQNTPNSTYNSDLQVTVPLFKHQILTFGGALKIGGVDIKENRLTDWTNEKTTTALTYQARGRDRTSAVFFQDEILLHEKLTAYVGLREDWWETYDGTVDQVGTSGYPKMYSNRSASSFSPKGALVYKPFGETTLRTSLGRAFRSPTLYDLYRTWTSASGTTYAGNPDLKPETSLSWDIGLEQGLWKGTKVKATYFENYISDMIYSKTVSTTLQSKVNAGRGESRGLELEAEQRFDKWLRLFFNLTYTDSVITENSANPASVGKDMVYTPKVIFNIGGDLEKGPFSISVNGRFLGKQFANDDNSDTAKHVYGAYDPFFAADAKIRYKVFSWATVSFSVNNIFDETYYLSSLAPGRSWFLDLTLTF